MKFKSMPLLIVALGFGAVAMLGVRKVLSGDKGAKEEVVEVLVATMDISPGSMLDETNTTFKEWAKKTVPEGAVTNLAEIEERALSSRAVPGEVIMLAKLRDKDWLPSNEIPSGMRVVSVPVDLTKTHSGLIRPGDRVDVLLTYKTREQNQMVSKSKIVLEYIEVFATDSLRTNNGVETSEVNSKNISFLVAPQQANMLMLAESKGALTLALRAPKDSKATDGLAISDLDFDKKPAEIGEENERPDNDRVMFDQAAKIKALQEEMQRQQEAKKPVEPVQPIEPDTAKWQIVIYSGRDRIVEEFELPEDDATGPVTKAESGTGVKTWLNKIFNSGT